VSSEIKGAVRPFPIAVDYDDTFTSCPETWTKVIEALREAGAHVFCVTYRTPDKTITDFPGEVYYTSGRLKAEYMWAEHHMRVRVWIDDMPEIIGENPLRKLLRPAAQRDTDALVNLF
jgi:hypothetical protein